jgi:glutathione synthase/RimK-type ligase-like ATP-grasp enzyme
MSIALLGDPEDLALTYVSWLAKRRGADTVLLPKATLGVDWSFNLNAAAGGGSLRVGTGTSELRDLSGVFVRFNPSPGIPEKLSLGAEAQGVLLHERREGLHHLLAAVCCPVVNRPSGGRSNASKPMQMMELRQAGFMVPRWVATNRLDVVETFARGCANGVIYKAAPGLRSRVRTLDDELLRRLLEGTSPTVVQAFIPGRDVRVHTVGDRAFATEMVSSAVDYRFESTTQYRATSIDPAIARLCCATGRASGLCLAGFDFRVTADGEWYCLEMNPVPSFLPYEMCSGQPIGEAVVDVLTSAN